MALCDRRGFTDVSRLKREICQKNVKILVRLQEQEAGVGVMGEEPEDYPNPSRAKRRIKGGYSSLAPDGRAGQCWAWG